MSQKSQPLTQRKKFAKFAKQLEMGIPPNEAQTTWLIGTFSALSNTHRETDRVLGLKYSPGQSSAKEQAASKMDMIMHWIAGAISNDASHLINPNDAEPAKNINDALKEATKIAKALFENDPNSQSYDYEYIKKCWYDKNKTYRQNLYRNSDSTDVFYEFPIK